MKDWHSGLMKFAEAAQTLNSTAVQWWKGRVFALARRIENYQREYRMMLDDLDLVAKGSVEIEIGCYPVMSQAFRP